MSLQIRREPCHCCPYRTDVPSGIWAAETYDKLLPYDEPTAEQPYVPFGCHATPEHLCHGWAVVHMSRGNEYELISLRILMAVDPDLKIPEAAVPLFGSGTEAAEHGKRDIDCPSEAALEATTRLLHKYDRLHQ